MLTRNTIFRVNLIKIGEVVSTLELCTPSTDVTDILVHIDVSKNLFLELILTKN